MENTGEEKRKSYHGEKRRNRGCGRYRRCVVGTEKRETEHVCEYANMNTNMISIRTNIYSLYSQSTNTNMNMTHIRIPIFVSEPYSRHSVTRTSAGLREHSLLLNQTDLP